MSDEPTTIVKSVAPVLPVLDVERALEHYRKLGFTAEPFGSSGEAFYGFVSMGPTEFHVARVDDLDPKTNTSALYCYVDDADAIYEKWLEAGVAGRFHEPTDTDYGLREFAFVDADGNLFRVGSQLAD